MTIHSLLSQYWGHLQFRPHQQEIIESVLEGRDTLALLPTGGGKSVCFQVPALQMEGICIVVSPLIALMKDQVETLKSKGIKAMSIVSGMGKREVDIALDNCIYGDFKFLYLSPERLMSDLVRERIRHMKVNLIAVDEAHCISQWGYDFRPSYLLINNLRELHPKVPILALTASATAEVAADIQEKLLFAAPNVFRKSFERKNLSYLVYDTDDKYRKLLSIVNGVQGTGIVYVRNRRETQDISRQLGLDGIAADYYHAGLEPAVRSAKQSAWKSSQTRIIVATNAFGMGIDKPDVRFVIHLDLPESLEAYYQEAGRGGRDEKKAFAVLLYNDADRLRLLNNLDSRFPSVNEIKTVYHQLGNFYQLAYGAGESLSLEFDIADFCRRYKADPIRTINALKFLEQNKYLYVSESVYLPSRVNVLANAEELYRFQVEQPAFDKFIKVLLRSYGGIFEQYVPVKESDLGKRAGLHKQEVSNMLTKLQELGILSYLPQTDKPLVTFTVPRADSTHLILDEKFIRERLAVTTRQVESVIRYAAEDKCRSIQILEYFDEADSVECGRCDVCLAKKNESKKAGLRDEIIREVLSVLGPKPLQIGDLVNALTAGDEKERIEVIRVLLDAGSIKTNGDYYYL